MATIPTQQTISNGAMANDGTGDSLRDAADKINNNFQSLWQSTYNGADDQPAREFVFGAGTDGYSKPAAGEVNAYNNGTPSNMTNFVNFRISQFDQSGAARVIPVQRDWDNGTGLYDSVTTTTTLTMYQKTNDSSLSSYEIVGQYSGTLYYKTQSNPPSATSPAAGQRYPSSYTFAPDSSDYWYFQTSNPGAIYREGSISAGDSCFIKIDNFW